MAIEKKRVIDIETGKAQSNVKSLRQEIKELREAMAGMEEGSEEWGQASQQLATAMDKQRKIAEAGKFATQDYGNMLGNLSSVGAGVVAGINGVTSALSLMGVEMNKDDVGMIKFTQSMMAIVQALASVDTATKAWDGLMTSLNAMLDQKIADSAATAANTAATEANTAASTKNAAAKKKQAAASGQSAAAMGTEAAAAGAASKSVTGLSGAFTKLAKALNISKAALGIWGLAIAAVTALMVTSIKRAREQKAEMDGYKQMAMDFNKVEVEAGAIYENYNRILHDSNESYEKRLGALNELKKAFPKYEAQLTREGQLYNDNNTYINQSIELLKKKARQRAVEEQYTQLLKEQYEAQEKLNEARSRYKAAKNAMNSTTFDLSTGGMYKASLGSAATADWLSVKSAEEDLGAIERKMKKIEEYLEQGLEDLGSFSSEITNTNNNTKQWNGEIRTLKESIEKLMDNISVLRNEFGNTLNDFFAGEGDIITRFKNKIEALVKGNRLVIGDLNIFSDQFNKFLNSFGKKDELHTVESQLQAFFNHIFTEGQKDLEQMKELGANIDNVFDAWVENISQIGDTPLQVGNEVIDVYDRLSKMLEGMRNNTSTINTLNIFNDAEILKLQESMRDLEERITTTTEAYRKLADKKGTMTDAEEKDLKAKQEQLRLLNEEYEKYKSIVGVYQAVIDAYNEGHEAQLQLFSSYKALMDRLRNFENELNEGTQWRTEDKIAVIQREIEEEKRLIETYRQQANEFPPNAEKRIEVENKILDSIVKIRQKEREITALTYQENLKAFEQYINEQEELYNYSISKQREKANLLGLGVEDYNAALEAIQFELDMEQNKFNKLEEMRKLDLISEQEYESRRIEMLRTFKDLELRMEEEKSNRKLKIFSTYYNGVKSITNAINGILSAAIEAEEDNKEKQKELRIAQTWMTGIMGSIEALVSGIQSGIPAPGNFILGGVLSAATLTETAMAAANIRKESGSTTSGAANINVPAYETLAYETNSNIEENVRDQRVYVVESDIQMVGNHVDTVESEAQF